MRVTRRAAVRCCRDAVLALLCAGLVTPAMADELKPFEVSYSWIYHGLGTVAVSNLKLTRGDSGTWVYTSRDTRGSAALELPRHGGDLLDAA
jgi:hypothetical protein